MLSVTQLARACGLSRSTVLYYESIGLLPRPPRSQGNYRRYGDAHLARLRQIGTYRDSGLKLADIRILLAQAGDGDGAAAVLRRRLAEIGAEIERLKGQQQAICGLLRYRGSTSRRRIMTKDKWIEIMRAAGLTQADRHRWHAEFEKAAPEDHQTFLEYLKIPSDEISAIRAECRTGGPRT